jgi:hypothetical protein
MPCGVTNAADFFGAAVYGSSERGRGGTGTFAVADAIGARFEPLAVRYPTSERPQ